MKRVQQVTKVPSVTGEEGDDKGQKVKKGVVHFDGAGGKR